MNLKRTLDDALALATTPVGSWFVDRRPTLEARLDLFGECLVSQYVKGDSRGVTAALATFKLAVLDRYDHEQALAHERDASWLSERDRLSLDAEFAHGALAALMREAAPGV